MTECERVCVRCADLRLCPPSSLPPPPPPPPPPAGDSRCIHTVRLYVNSWEAGLCNEVLRFQLLGPPPGLLASRAGRGGAAAAAAAAGRGGGRRRGLEGKGQLQDTQATRARTQVTSRAKGARAPRTHSSNTPREGRKDCALGKKESGKERRNEKRELPLSGALSLSLPLSLSLLQPNPRAGKEED